MDHVLVRYSEIGTKSRRVRGGMLSLLRERVEERADYEGFEAGIESVRGRILVRTDEAVAAAEALAELPGVASTSPAVRTDPTMDAIEAASDRFEVGETFGVDANTAGEHAFTSREVNETVGARVEERTCAGVDLDDPDTWIEVDVRGAGAFVFTERFEGPGGFPVGSQAGVAALISGGIDSPVAAYEAMTRGADVVPIYFYNRPYAAGDHLARFEAALSRLRRINPGKTWYYHRVDMEDANESLFEVETGRMLLHRAVLFGVAERVAEDEGLRALVTGEAIGQKSSQTVSNLELTGSTVSTPILRPLLSRPKERIVDAARDLGTFEVATVDSACRTIAPDHPAPEMDPDRFARLAREVDLDRLVETAYATTERVDL